MIPVLRLPVVLFAWWCALATAAPVTVVDDTGRRVSLAAPAQRIVTLSPHVTELVYAAGAGGSLVAVSAHSDYPEQAASLPAVAGGGGVDVERVVALKPDLVIGWASGNPATAISQLDRLGIPVFLSEVRRLEQIATSLTRIGALAGTTAAARRERDRFETQLAQLRNSAATGRPVRLFFQIDRRPLMTLGGHHLADEVFHACGGRNVFASLSTLAAVVGYEDVLRADPEVILVATSADPVAAAGDWQRFPGLAAVRHGQVYQAPAAVMVRPTPRILEGIGWLCTTLDRVRRNPR